jgi:hypothetical protein
MAGNDVGVVGNEPGVPFLRVPGDEYQAKAPFDFVVPSRSPAYTPPVADVLTPVIYRIPSAGVTGGPYRASTRGDPIFLGDELPSDTVRL